MFKKLKSRFGNQKGFTCIETILTTVILSVGLMGSMMVMHNATANTVNNDFSTVATQLANEKIEQILADKQFISFASITNDNYPNEVVTDVYNMSRTVSVTEVNSENLSVPEAGSGLKSVAVTVSWGDQDYQFVTVTTLLADYQ